MFITTCLESRAADDHKVKKFTEFLPCTFAMNDCRQLEDVSSVENVHMVTEIIYLKFLSGAITSIFHHLVVLCHGHLVHFSSRDDFICI